MTTIAQSFPAASASFTLNSTSWAQAVTISSNAIDISAMSPIPDDILITVEPTFPNSTMGAQKAVNVYVSCLEGTLYDDNDQYSGTNNSQTTLRSPTNFKGPFVINATINVALAGTFSLLGFLGWRSLPRKFGIILENQCNQTISTIAATYSPTNYTNA